MNSNVNIDIVGDLGKEGQSAPDSTDFDPVANPIVLHPNSVCYIEKESDEIDEATGKKKKVKVEAFTAHTAELIVLYQKLRATDFRSAKVEPAFGVIFAVANAGVEKTPFQVSFYAGGMNIDLVQPTGALVRMLSYGFDRRTRRNIVTGRNGNPPTPVENEVADWLFGEAGAIFNTDEGRKFLAWCHSKAAAEYTVSKRTTRPGFSLALAVSSDHWFNARRSEDEVTYKALSDDRKALREAGLPLSGAAGSVASLPF